jgi:hypothetical protein
MSIVHLRHRQRAALDAFRTATEPDFLAVATPGAGKTTVALACVRTVLADEPRRLVVVAPTSHIKTQWARAAHRLGLELEPEWAPGDGLARDVHGIVTTCQQVATGDTAGQLRSLAVGAFVILDEVHHAGDDQAWGDNIRRAFELADRRLCLSGTPFRSDTAAIPFVRYVATAEGLLAVADYTYSYARRCATAAWCARCTSRASTGRWSGAHPTATWCAPASTTSSTASRHRGGCARHSASKATGSSQSSWKPTSVSIDSAATTPPPAGW